APAPGSIGRDPLRFQIVAPPSAAHCLPDTASRCAPPPPCPHTGNAATPALTAPHLHAAPRAGQPAPRTHCLLCGRPFWAPPWALPSNKLPLGYSRGLRPI